MLKHRIDLARAMKDREYFNGLSEAEQAQVRETNPIGQVDVTDQQLESVSGGLSGGDHIESTTTTTNLPSCSCSDAPSLSAVHAAKVRTEVRVVPDCTCAC
jgi:hypothetical protein